jgi:hypothetical protein
VSGRGLVRALFRVVLYLNLSLVIVLYR